MKKSLIVSLLSLLALSGCSNLNVSWNFTASYNALVQSQTLMQHVPKGDEQKSDPPPSVSPGKGS